MHRRAFTRNVQMLPDKGSRLRQAFDISIDIDPAFLLIDPEAQIVFSTGVDQTGPNTLPTGGQP